MKNVSLAIHLGLIHETVRGVGGLEGPQGISVYIIFPLEVAFVRITFPRSREILIGGGRFFLIFEKVDLLSKPTPPPPLPPPPPVN